MHPILYTLLALSSIVCTVNAVSINHTRLAEEEAFRPFSLPDDKNINYERFLNYEYAEEDDGIIIEDGNNNVTLNGSTVTNGTTGNDTLQNTTGKKQNTCRSCVIREEQRKKRINDIKQRISHVLKLDVLGTPNATRNKLPKAPSFVKLQQKFENRQMQADSPGYDTEELLYEEEKEEYGEPQRTFAFAKELPEYKTRHFDNTIFFETPTSAEKEPYKAILWVYISKELVIGRNRTEINLYTIDPPGKKGGPPMKREVGYKKKHYMKAAGWHHFNVMSEVRKWSIREELNMGLVIESLDAEGRNIVTMPMSSGETEGYEPMLDIRTTLRRNIRRKRSTHLNCDDRDEEVVACCRYPLVVNFVDFGWDFVIAPLTYQAYYCAGECRGESMETTLHANVLSQAPTPIAPSLPSSSLSNTGPCCTPTHMSSLTMLYFDHNLQVELTQLPRMKADRCGCA